MVGTGVVGTGVVGTGVVETGGTGVMGVGVKSEGVWIGGRGSLRVSTCGELANSLHCQPSSTGSDSRDDAALEIGLVGGVLVEVLSSSCGKGTTVGVSISDILELIRAERLGPGVWSEGSLTVGESLIVGVEVVVWRLTALGNLLPAPALTRCGKLRDRWEYLVPYTSDTPPLFADCSPPGAAPPEGLFRVPRREEEKVDPITVARRLATELGMLVSGWLGPLFRGPLFPLLFVISQRP